MPREVLIVIGGVIAAVVSFLTAVINPRLANWKDKKEFKRKHNYEQLKELYLELYSIVVQSEYLRYFIKNYSSKEDLPFNDFPFLEIVHTKNGIPIKNPISEYNKSKIQSLILENQRFASQDLLKLAVAYRYVHHHYERNNTDEKMLSNYQDEELRLIAKIVITIIKETNQFLEECNMNFNGKEISYGIMDLSVIENKIFNEHLK